MANNASGGLKLCDVCKKRPALCYCTNIILGVEVSRCLCNECFDALASTKAREFLSQARSARCCYCGGYPCAGGSDVLGLETDIQKARFMCVVCMHEYLRFLSEKLESLPSGLPREEQMAAIRIAHDDVEIYMKRWVRRATL